jgi:transcriptional regulator with XRE-family HTH domain
MGTKKWTETRFSELVKEQRWDVNKWTQRDLATKLTEKGTAMHWTTIAKIEHCERSVRIDEAAALADVFGVSVDYLLGRRARPKGDLMFILRRLSETMSRARWNASSLEEALREQSDELHQVDDTGRFAAYIAGCAKVADACAAVVTTAESIEFFGGEMKRGTQAAMRAMLAADDA